MARRRLAGCSTDMRGRQVVRSAAVDPWPAGCGFTSSARAVSKLWHRVLRPLVGGELLCCLVMKCPVMADEWGWGEETKRSTASMGVRKDIQHVWRYFVFVCTWACAFLDHGGALLSLQLTGASCCSNCLFIARQRRPMAQGRQIRRHLKNHLQVGEERSSLNDSRGKWKRPSALRWI